MRKLTIPFALICCYVAIIKECACEGCKLDQALMLFRESKSYSYKHSVPIGKHVLSASSSLNCKTCS
jgi:hypothetical protein